MEKFAFTLLLAVSLCYATLAHTLATPTPPSSHHSNSSGGQSILIKICNEGHGRQLGCNLNCSLLIAESGTCFKLPASIGPDSFDLTCTNYDKCAFGTEYLADGCVPGAWKESYPLTFPCDTCIEGNEVMCHDAGIQLYTSEASNCSNPKFVASPSFGSCYNKSTKHDQQPTSFFMEGYGKCSYIDFKDYFIHKTPCGGRPDKWGDLPSDYCTTYGDKQLMSMTCLPKGATVSGAAPLPQEMIPELHQWLISRKK